jgi:hypothetical protein
LWMDVISPQSAPGALTSREEFTTAEAAKFLGCSEGYLIKLRGDGGPPFQRRYKRKGIFYHRADLERWRAGRRYLSTSEYEFERD